MRRPGSIDACAALIGLLALLLGATPTPPLARLLLVPGVVGVFGAAIVARPGFATVAGCAIVGEVAVAHTGTLLVGGEVVLLLVYLLLADLAESLPSLRSALAEGLRPQLPLAAGACLLAAAVLAIAVLPVPGWTWLVLLGMLAAVAALGLSLHPGNPDGP